ncbi:hypothetical protein NQ314_016142 [Rhamnusium bicolor]|uniref:CCHC-type domain-containing protein n=1 Tax=Rhamnusium bicolor TaxID=1586634 RepID=A0AAV8WWZ1_9CUCU|nr:hypothetical protein NQ314_016142 [Rhamnusium bicolor]
MLGESFTRPPPKNKSLIPELAYASTSRSYASTNDSRNSIHGISEVCSGNNRSQNNDTNSSSDKTCWNCGGSGHLSTRCPKPQERYCYSCGFRNVTVRTCPKCNRRPGNGQLRHYYVLDYVLAHVKGDERPYLTVSIFGKSLLGLLDSGASRTIIGGKGWKILKSIGLVNLEKCDLKSVTVANGNSCDCIGILRAPVRLRDVEKIIDILVVPELNHSLILGIDFWLRMGIVPNISSNKWKFSLSDCINVDSLEALNPRSALTDKEADILNQFIYKTFKKMGDKLGRTNIVEHRIEVPVSIGKILYYRMRHSISSKLAPKYVGPFVVAKKVSPWTYELKDVDGRFRGTWHAKDLKPSPEHD